MQRPMMQMYFHFRINEPILFREWIPGNLTAYLFSVFGVLLLGFAYELLRVLRALIFQAAERYEHQQDRPQCCLEEEQIVQSPSTQTSSDATNAPAVVVPGSSTSGDCDCLSPQLFYDAQPWPWSAQLCSLWHLFQSVLHFCQFFLGFSLMLVAMTYNVPIFTALIMGHSLGYFLTAPLYRHGLAEEGRVGGECCCS